MADIILIVDDNLDNVELLRKRFRAAGFETIEGYDGEQAVALTREHLPSIILLDIMMPKLDGFEVCQVLKEQEKTRHIPIIMLTAKREVPDKVKGFGLGADDYVTKPFNFPELLARVQALLKTRSFHERQIEHERQKALDQMVDGVAHEVRNPVAAIGGFARRISDELPDDDRKKKYAQVILKETERLERMVQDIFKFKMVPNGERTAEDFHDLLDDMLRFMKPKLEQAGIQVVRRYAPNLPHVTVHRKNMVTAFGQLVTNAIEAMEGGGTMTVITLLRDSGELEVTITDTGRGIAEKDLDSVFDPFFTTKMVGAGMGLPLVRRIVEDHHGTVGISSRLGEGTTVRVVLPVT
ncbi:MAG: response regulator [Deltaproteobacteria bacterium]|nr:response regulator [Candidatus Anaeroferrophillacea bacterium]